MAQAIGDSLPLAIGIAISPVPIIAVILMLLSRRAGTNSLAFVIGWVVGVAVATSVVVAIAGTQSLSTSNGAASGVSWLKVGLGVLLLAVGRRHWRQRPKPGDEVKLPKWLSAIEELSPPKAAGLGVLLSAINPKNLLLIIAGGVAIAQGTTDSGSKAVAIVVFVLIGTVTVATPVVLFHLMGARATALLGTMKTWLTANNATVMAVLIVVIGFVLIGKGIGGF